MCAMLALIVPDELKLGSKRALRFVESYVGELHGHLKFRELMCNPRDPHAATTTYGCGIHPQEHAS